MQSPLAIADIAQYIDNFYSSTRRHGISAASVPSDSKRLINRFETVSTESW
jgi:hypothetical protein